MTELILIIIIATLWLLHFISKLYIKRPEVKQVQRTIRGPLDFSTQKPLTMQQAYRQLGIPDSKEEEIFNQRKGYFRRMGLTREDAQLTSLNNNVMKIGATRRADKIERELADLKVELKKQGVKWKTS